MSGEAKHYFNLLLKSKYAIVIPVANEEDNIALFYAELVKQLKIINLNFKLYFVADNASKDNTIKILKNLSKTDKFTKIIFEPTNQNVVDAYLRGFKQAIVEKNDYVIEMDAGFSHQPSEIIKFVKKLNDGYDCVFGIRPLLSPKYKISIKRRILSLGGTVLSNTLLGTKLTDATSGFEAFRADILKEIIKEPLLSKGHFFQTEIRYRAKKYNISSTKITYAFPSNNVNVKSIINSFKVLFILFLREIKFKNVN